MIKIWDWAYQLKSQKKSNTQEEGKHPILTDKDYLESRYLLSEISEEYNSIRSTGIKNAKDVSKLLKALR